MCKKGEKMVREFYLENEKGQRFSLMNIVDGGFLSSPGGLGYSYNIQYSQIGNDFLQNIRKIEQGQINGEIIFNKYDNYKKFVDFIESAILLKFVYKIPFDNGFTEYFKDIDISNVDKSEIRNRGCFKSSCDF